MFRLNKDIADKFNFVSDKNVWCYYSKEIDADEMKKCLEETFFLKKIPAENILRKSRNLLAHYKFTASVKNEQKEFILKKYQNKNISSWIKYGLRKSKAVKGWEKVFEFLNRGVNTPKPSLVLEKRAGVFLIYSCLMVERVTDFVTLREVLKRYRNDKEGKLTGEKEKFLILLAKFVRDMHNSGIVHRDLSGGNILIQNFPDLDRLIFNVIDINRARVKKELNIYDRMKDLERIRIEPNDRIFFFEQYCMNDKMYRCYKSIYLKKAEKYRYRREHKLLIKRFFSKLFE